MKKIFPLFLILLLFSFIPLARAESEKTKVIVFTQTGCAYCAKSLSHLENLKRDQYPNLEITEYDIRRDPNYYQTFVNYQNAYGSSADGTPVIFIGNKMIKGYLPNEIDKTLENCEMNTCQDPEKFVADYIKEHPSAAQQQQKDKTVVGWVILGVMVVGGGIIWLSRG